MGFLQSNIKQQHLVAGLIMKCRFVRKNINLKLETKLIDYVERLI